jgi:hypothetical protein
MYIVIQVIEDKTANAFAFYDYFQSKKFGTLNSGMIRW